MNVCCPTCGQVQTIDPDSHPLTILRAQHGWSFGQLARRIARTSERLGVRGMATERQKTWRWEARGVTPDRPARRAIAVIVGLPPEVADIVQWPLWLVAMVAPEQLEPAEPAELEQAS